MSKSSSVKSILVLFMAGIAAFVLVVSDIVVAQNTNSSGSMQDENTNTTTTNAGRRGRRNRRGRAARNTNTGTENMDATGTDANLSQDAASEQGTTSMNANANSTLGRRGRQGRRGRRGGSRSGAGDMTTDTTTGTTGGGDTTDTTGGTGQNTGGDIDTTGNMSREEADLSGTYSGTLSFPEHNVNGPATLTITGNTYTLEGGGMTHSGRITGVTTRGYTGVTMELGPTEEGQMPTFVSVRARRTGNGLSLMSVPGERHRFSFTSGGGGGGGGGTRARGTRTRTRARRGHSH